MIECDIAVVGGGAAGLFAAVAASWQGARVAIIEKNKLASKIKLTGKGRCNLTNDCDPRDFLDKVVTNRQFLYSAINALSPRDTMDFFTELGVKLKTERGGRVFPQSDSAVEVAHALADAARRECRVVYGEAVSLEIDADRLRSIVLKTGERVVCRAAIICCGGMSYPLTGSDGGGYALARLAGHTIIPPVPSLVPIICGDDFIPEIEGLSLKNIALHCENDKKTVFSAQGELLFTENGVSGPLALSCSSYINRLCVNKLALYIDLKPALSEDVLDQRLLRDLKTHGAKSFKNSLFELLPRALVAPVVQKTEIDPDKKSSGITAAERKRLLDMLKRFALTPIGLGPMEEAVVTSGGVSTGELDPRTMGSRLVEGLYFAGEIIDTDALTGGFNLQIAWSTAFLAARAAGGNI